MKKTLCLVLSILFLSLSACSKITEVPEIKKEIDNKQIIKEYDEFQTLLLDLHNQQRKSKNLEKLILNKKLCDYAQKHAEKMAEKSSLYHSSMSQLIKVNSDSTTVGENIAWGQNKEIEVLNDWLNSTGHRWNVLSKNYKRAGFGKYTDKDGRNYWCAVYTN